MDISHNVSHLQESHLNDFSYDDDEENKNITIGGIPLQNIYENSEWIKPFQCFLCNNVAVQPIRCSSCSGLFCKGCILSWESRNEMRKMCPKCQSQQSFNISTQESELKPDYNTQKFLQDINVDCVYKKNGCQDIITYAEYEDHVKNCPKRMKICLNCGENFIYDQADLHKNLCQLQSIQMDNNKSISEYSIRPSQLGFQNDLKTFSDLPSIGGSHMNLQNNQFGTNKNNKPKRNSEKIHVRNFKQNQNKGRYDSPHSLSYINSTLQQIQENSMTQIEEMCIHENQKKQQQQMYLENSKIEEESQLLNQTESNKQVENQTSFQKVRNSDRQTGSNNNSGIYNEQNNNSYVNQHNQSIDKQSNQLNAIQVQPQQVISISQNNSHLIIGISFLILILLSLLLFNQYNQNQQYKQDINESTISNIKKESYQFHKELQEYLNSIREKYNSFQLQQQNEIQSVKINIENYINQIKLLQQSQDDQLKSQIVNKVQEQNEKIATAVNHLKQDYQNSLNELIRKQEYFQNEFTKVQQAKCNANSNQIESNNHMIISKIKSDLDLIIERQISIQLTENNKTLKQVVTDLSSLDIFIKKQDQELNQIKQTQKQQLERISQQTQNQNTSEKLHQQFYETLQSNLTAIYQNLNHQINENQILFQEQLKILTQDVKNVDKTLGENNQILQNENKEIKSLVKSQNLEFKTQIEDVLIQIKDLNQQFSALKTSQQEQNNSISQKYDQLINNQIKIAKEQDQQQQQFNNSLNEKISQQNIGLQKLFSSAIQQFNEQVQQQIKNSQIDQRNDLEDMKQELKLLRQLIESIGQNQLNIQQLPNNSNNQNNLNQNRLENVQIQENQFQQELIKIYQDLNHIKQFNNNQIQLIQQLIQNQPSKQNNQEILEVINKLIQDVQIISLQINKPKQSDNQNFNEIIQNQINQMKQQLDTIDKNLIIQSQKITQLSSQEQQRKLADDSQINKLLADVLTINSMINKIFQELNKNKEIKIEQVDNSELKQNLDQQLQKYIQSNQIQITEVQEIKHQIQKFQQLQQQSNLKLEEKVNNLIGFKQLFEDFEKQLINLKATQIVNNQMNQSDINIMNNQEQLKINKAPQEQQTQYSQVVIPFTNQGEDIKEQQLDESKYLGNVDQKKYLQCDQELQNVSFESVKKEPSVQLIQLNQTRKIQQIAAFYNQQNYLVYLEFKFKFHDQKIKEFICGNNEDKNVKKVIIELNSELVEIKKSDKQIVLNFSKILNAY
ncbi:hypothetical protein ABPG73_007498 [Tetrahymena malaccensis]